MRVRGLILDPCGSAVLRSVIESAEPRRAPTGFHNTFTRGMVRFVSRMTASGFPRTRPRVPATVESPGQCVARTRSSGWIRPQPEYRFCIRATHSAPTRSAANRGQRPVLMSPACRSRSTKLHLRACTSLSVRIRCLTSSPPPRRAPSACRSPRIRTAWS